MEQPKSVDRITISMFWSAALREKRLLVLALLHPLGAICISTLVPLFIGKTLGTLTIPGGDPTQYVSFLIVSGIVGVFGNRLGFKYLLSHQALTMNYLQNKALETLLRRSVGFHNNNIGGKLVSDAIDYPSGYSQLANAFFLNLVPFAIILIVGTTIIFIESWQLGLVIAVMTIISVIWGVHESKNRSPLRAARLKATKEVTGHLADAILNVQTVKTFAHEQTELKSNQKLSKKLLDMRLNDWQLAASQGNNRIAALMVMQMIFVVVAVHLVRNDPALLGIGIFAFTFTITLSNKLFEINIMLRNIEDGMLAASPMTEILLSEPEIRDKKGAKPLAVTKGEIALRNVHFRYADSTSDEHVFKRLNLTVTPGEKIGLVGPSGGGKSTLTRLLLRFDDINDGEIAIDGQNVAAITQESLRQAVSYVPQEPLLFHRSVYENIAYGKPGASLEEVKKAARQAHAADFIEALPGGYETIVGERGVKLSGGQRQRIAIARALLKDAPILILDEATSALDSESEVLIQKALWKLMERRTALVIAHRLSTIQKMDRIIVLEDGDISEQGTHEQLLIQKGTYAKLWAHQSGGFIEE